MLVKFQPWRRCPSSPQKCEAQQILHEFVTKSLINSPHPLVIILARSG